MKELLVEAIPENLSLVLSFVKTELQAHGTEGKLQRQIAIAVEEIFVNIAHYAYNPEIGNAVIRVCIDEEVSIEFEDNGNPYNPLEKTDPDTTLKAKERRIGGLGVFMVKKIMDSVDYRFENGKNIVKIRKIIL